MFVVLCIFCYEETCSFLAHFTKDVPISSIPFCLPVFARHMQGVPTALLQKILPHLRDTDKKSLDLNSPQKKSRTHAHLDRGASSACRGSYGYSMRILGCPETCKRVPSLCWLVMSNGDRHRQQLKILSTKKLHSPPEAEFSEITCIKNLQP